MLRFSRHAVLLCILLCPSFAVAGEAPAACADAAIVAERNWTLPPNLIHAIGRVESGRVDRATGRIAPWPWTVNANGSGFQFASRTEAVDFVRTQQSRGVRLIDVGCFQIDLFYHPAAFSSLEQAFDPAANADYAARFLTDLHSRTGTWPAAIAGYHSGKAQEGERYRQKVMSQWTSDGAMVRTVSSPNTSRTFTARAINDPYVVLMSAAARAIPVLRP